MDAPTPPLDRGPDRRVGAALDPDVEHFEAHCPIHGTTTHARHKAGRSRGGRQRYNDRCLACHTAYNLAHPPVVEATMPPASTSSRLGAPSHPETGTPARTTTPKKAPMTAPEPGTVNARPITFAEVTHLDATREPQEVYYLTEIGTLTPATITITSRARSTEGQEGGTKRTSRRNGREYFAAIVDEKASEREGHTVYKPDVARGPIGEYVKADILDIFGSIHGGGLFTSSEAEEATALMGLMRDPASTRRNVYVADPNADAMPLTPVYGSMLTFSGVVADISPEELAQRAEKALRAEFGPAMRANAKILTRPVEDRRVDVTDSETGRTIALGILKAEVHYVTRVGGGITVSTSDPDVIIG